MMDIQSERRSATVSPVDAERIATAARPERRLMLAVLEAAVSDFRKYATAANGLGRRRFVEADAWFRSHADDRLLDFESVCHALALDPSFIRGGLARWCAERRVAADHMRTRPPMRARTTGSVAG